MKKPLISIIIPCYNQGNYLAEAIKSCVSQTYSLFECIIINDGSSDNTDDISKWWCASDSRIKYISRYNTGVSSSRNLGLKHARGDFIQFLDADDLLQPDKFKLSISEFNLFPDIDIIVSSAMYFDVSCPSQTRFNIFDNTPWMDELWSKKNTLISKLIKGNLMPVCSPLIRKNVFDKVGYFDTSISACEDWDFWLRCAIHGIRFRYNSLPNGDVRIRVHKTSASQNRDKMFSGEFYLSVKTSSLLVNKKDIISNFSIGLERLERITSSSKQIGFYKLLFSQRNIFVVLWPAFKFFFKDICRLPHLLRKLKSGIFLTS
jgi:glycosyltransferase involved in cell wall biosynthesis